MIQGVTIFRASQLRTAIEATTRTASVTAAAFGGFRTVTRSRSGQAAARGRVRSTARADLPETLGRFVRQLGEPADVADHQRPPEAQRSDHDPRRLAHRRVPEVDADVAGGEEGPEPGFVDVVDADHVLADAQFQAVVDRGEPQPRRGGADEQEQRLREPRAQAGERLEQLREPLRRVQVAVAADDDPTFWYLDGRELRRRDPGRMRNAPDRLAVAGLPDELLDVH